MSSKTFILTGGNEFEKGLEFADQEAIALAGVASASPGLCLVVAITNSQRKGEELSQAGAFWFSNMGARNCERLALSSLEACNDPQNVAKLEKASLLYLVGGDPAFMLECIQDSELKAVFTNSLTRNGVLGGSGSGAAVLAQYVYLEDRDELVAGLGLIPAGCLIPYHSSKGRKWAKRLAELLPTAYVFGIDDKTSAIGYDNNWRVYGRGWVTVYKGGKPRKFVSGQPFMLNPKRRV
jgi:cyanophycinase